MADEVIIGNVGGSDGVASEATLQALVRAVEKMGNQRGQKGSGSKVQDLHNKAVEAGTEATNAQTDTVEKNTEAVKDSTKAAENFGRSLGNMAARGIGQVVSSLAGMTKSLLAGEDSMEAYASQIPIFGSVLGSIAGYLDRSVDAFREMSAVGAGFNNDILAMRRAAAENNLSLDEFKNVVTKNSQSLAALGGTVTGGIQRFTAMNRALKDTGDFESLKAMGFSIMEINEGMADYVALQTRLGRIEGKTTQELAAGSANYLKELDLLAKVTGKSRQQLADEQAQRAADSSFRALANQFKEGSKEAENFNRNMALIETLPAETAAGLKDLADGVAQTDYGKMIQATQPELAEAMRQVGRGADPKILQDAMRKAGRNIEKQWVGAGPNQAAFLSSLGETAPALKGLIDSGTKLTEASNRQFGAAEEEQKKRNETTRKLTTFQDAIKKMSEAIQIAFVDSGILELFATGVGMAANMITGFADSIKAFTAKFKDDPLGAVVDLLKDSIVGLFKNTGVVAALIGGITALFLGKAALSAMNNAMSGWATKTVGKVFGGGAAATTAGAATRGASAAAGVAENVKPSQAGKGFGEAIGNIGKGIGQGVGGVLKGLASGLAAFANPAILVGAGILGGAIVAIGAGIAGATWLMGKALPTFAEGLQGFADIDGGNLLKVAAGIGALGAAMAAMGAGQLVGAVTGALGGLAQGIAGFFGADPPLKKLQEFGAMNINAERVKANAEAVVAYSKAMAGLGAGGAVGAIGNLARSAVEGITSFFGGEVDIPWARVKAFADVNIDAKRVKANSEAVAAFGDAMSKLPTITRGRSGGLIGTVADFFLGAEREQVPWAQMVAFGQMMLPTASIKANSEAMAAFGEALSKLPEVKRERTGGLIGSVADFFVGAETQQVPWAQVVAFGQYQLPAAQIKSNAEAVAAFGEAMSKLPASMPTVRTGGLIESISTFFGGEKKMPWDEMITFGRLQLPSANIKANSEALTAFGTALSSFKNSAGGGGAINIPPGIAESLGRLAAIGSGDGLQKVGAGLQSIANVQNLQTTLGSLNALDATKLTSYNVALRDLTKALADLNKELANENRGGLFGMGESKANAGEILKNISVNTSAGAGNTSQLNETLTRIFEVLTETKSLNEKIEKNTKGMGSDISGGSVSKF